MKWIKKEPKKDGAYLTYVEASNAFGMLMRIEGKWYGRVAQGTIPVPSVQGIDFFTRITRPTK